MPKAIAWVLLLAFPLFEQRAMAGDRTAHLLDTTLTAPVLVPHGQLALVPSALLLAAADTAPADEACTEECDPQYYDPATGSDCVQVCGEAEEDEADAEAEEAQEEPEVVVAVQAPRQDNLLVWVVVGLGLAVAIGVSSYLVSIQCDASSGRPCP